MPWPDLIACKRWGVYMNVWRRLRQFGHDGPWQEPKWNLDVNRRWNNAWGATESPDYHCNLGRTPPEKSWAEEQRRRRADLDQQLINQERKDI